MEDIPCTYRISVKAIIRDVDGRILLIRERDGRWELPGGGLEHGEDPRQGLEREVLEETGYEVTRVSERPAGFWTIRKDVGSIRLKYFAIVAYEVEASGRFDPALHANKEADEAAYFTLDEAKSLDLHDNTRPYFAL